jgi:hypothetical protein
MRRVRDTLESIGDLFRGDGLLILFSLTGTAVLLRFVIFRKPDELGNAFAGLCAGMLILLFLAFLSVSLSRHSSNGPWALWLGLGLVPLIAGASLLTQLISFGMQSNPTGCLSRLGPGAALQYCRLQNQDLRDRDLSGADLSGADLTGADLTGANLEGVRLDGATLAGARGLSDEALAALLNVTLQDLPAELSRRVIHLESRADIRSALEGACSGTPAAQASAYGAQGSFSPVMMFGPIQPPPEWEPMAVRFAELVVCEDQEMSTFKGTCSYTGGNSLDQYEYTLAMAARLARRGDYVDSTSIAGKAECPQSWTFADRSRLEGNPHVEGQHVEFADAETWLGQFVFREAAP